MCGCNPKTLKNGVTYKGQRAQNVTGTLSMSQKRRLKIMSATPVEKTKTPENAGGVATKGCLHENAELTDQASYLCPDCHSQTDTWSSKNI